MQTASTNKNETKIQQNPKKANRLFHGTEKFATALRFDTIGRIETSRLHIRLIVSQWVRHTVCCIQIRRYILFTKNPKMEYCCKSNEMNI